MFVSAFFSVCTYNLTFDEVVDDLVCADAFGFGVVVSHDAVAQDVVGDGYDIFGVW